MEIVLHLINARVKMDGEVCFVINVHMDFFQTMEIVDHVVNVAIMVYVQMDQMEMALVRVIQVIQHLVIQQNIVIFVRMVM